MPIVLRVDGFDVVVLLPPREHGPAHVHVRKAGKEVVIVLSSLAVRKVEGMRSADVVTAVGIVADHSAELLNAWRKYHG
ncbi:MAG: hypothetical protein JWL71_433 [Acidobacteria bacterium]|nr:hypothetical protein [Acidobacteriota bacterium]